MGFWVFNAAREPITFSHLTGEEGERLMSESWHPNLLVALVVLKLLVTFGASMFPWVATRPFRSLLGTLPFFAVFAAENLAVLWWDHFSEFGFQRRLTSHPGYEHCLFGLIFIGLLFGSWTMFKAMEWLSGGRHALASHRIGAAAERRSSRHCRPTILGKK